MYSCAKNFNQTELFTRQNFTKLLWIINVLRKFMTHTRLLWIHHQMASRGSPWFANASSKLCRMSPESMKKNCLKKNSVANLRIESRCAGLMFCLLLCITETYGIFSQLWIFLELVFIIKIPFIALWFWINPFYCAIWLSHHGKRKNAFYGAFWRWRCKFWWFNRL